MSNRLQALPVDVRPTPPLVAFVQAFDYLRDEWDGEAEEFCKAYHLFTQCRAAGVEFGETFTFAMDELHQQCRDLDLDSDSDGGCDDMVGGNLTGDSPANWIF